MDNKSWLWKKKSSEKTIIATNKFGISVKGINEELPLGNEVGVARPVRNLNEKLASVLLDSHAKDDLVLKQENSVQEENTGQEKMEMQVVSLKKELDEAIKQGVAANEKLTISEAALKQCMQQLRSVHQEEEQRRHDAFMKASRESEKAQKQLEEKLREMSKRLADLAIENTNLSKALVLKEKLVEELHKHASQTAAEFNALMARLDSTEKENAFLKYEFHMLEKELEVRSEELEYTRRSAEVSHRQHLESIRKITKLEAECQRLQILVRKKLPGPAALAKMKNELEMLGRDSLESRRKANLTRDLVLRDTPLEKSPVIPIKNINFLIEQLQDTEEENKTLKDILTKKNAELRSARIMYSHTASKLSQVESQLVVISKGQKAMDMVNSASPLSKELYPLSGFDTGSDDGVSSSGSWANPITSELEHFRDAKLKSLPECKSIEVSDISLMDDFVEMEKLALVSAQAPSGGCNHHLSAGKELVPVVQSHFDCSDKQEIHSKDIATDKSFDWLQEVLNTIFKQQRISKRSLIELLEDIKIALGYVNHPSALEADTTAISRHPVESDIRSYITWKSPNISSVVESVNEASSVDTLKEETSKQHSQSNMSKSICKIIQLIEGIDPTPLVCNSAKVDVSKGKESLSPLGARADYFVHVFQWRSFELKNVLERFLHTCSAMLNGKVDPESFAEEVSCALDWILNNCISPKDSSSKRDKIKRHFSQNESQSESEAGGYLNHPQVEEKSLCLPIIASSDDQKICNLQDENKRLNDKLKNMECRLQSATDEIETLKMQYPESEQSIKSLQLELETTKESKRMLEDQIEHQNSINEDLDTQLTVAKAKLNEVLQQFSALEVELEEKCNCCEELEATCLELQLQLESVAKKDSLNYSVNQEGPQHQNGSEITAASLKLAECQETILNLGKQLKALATPREAALFDKVFNSTSSTTTATVNKNLNRRFSLRDQMKAEDSAKAIILKSPTKDSENPSNNSNAQGTPNVLVRTPEAKDDPKQKAGNTLVGGALAIVPVKKQGGVGFLRRLLMRRKKGSSKKSRLDP
ncbi:filament-like plant protein 7 [Ricinus communis]|uniref:filament-like plant protein 7 n=1 Tax=Ricinus communis TaxID=3988 RepID=UPI00201B0E1D|nr:filament-like plant protein 7 [Ricinus communis]XP_048231820.1 filament-like plant protein 7 [Ricinus communis]